MIHEFSMCEDHFPYYSMSEASPNMTTICEILSIHFFVSVAAETYVGKTGLVTGWGTLKEDGKRYFSQDKSFLVIWYVLVPGKPSCILQEVDVPILSNDDCTTKTNYTSKMITNNMMCAGYPGVGQRDSCQGLLINKSTFSFKFWFISHSRFIPIIFVKLQAILVSGELFMSKSIDCNQLLFSRWSTPGWARRQTVWTYRNRFVGKWVSFTYNVALNHSPTAHSFHSIFSCARPHYPGM